MGSDLRGASGDRNLIHGLKVRRLSVRERARRRTLAGKSLFAQPETCAYLRINGFPRLPGWLPWPSLTRSRACALQSSACRCTCPWTSRSSGATGVYRMFDTHGEALYVGKTCGTAIIQRLSQHLTDINPTHRKPWRDEVRRVDVTAFDTPEEAGREEDLQIKRLSPKYNKTGKPMAGSATLTGM